jgi:hypothetical protein
MQADPGKSVLDKILSTPMGGTVLLTPPEIMLIIDTLATSAATGAPEIWRELVTTGGCRALLGRTISRCNERYEVELAA